MCQSTPRSLSLFALILPVVLANLEVHQGLQKVVYTTSISPDSDVNCDPTQDIYPVITLPDSCPYNPLLSCPGNDLEIECHIKSLCPNGTIPLCVKNEYPEITYLLPCIPNERCDNNVRFIMYVERRNPTRYKLVKERCRDGYIQEAIQDCFSRCKRDKSIRVYKKHTQSRGPIVYCNYPSYCTPNKPKLFELTDASSPCELVYMKHELMPCPTGYGRLSDCNCEPVCLEGYTRNVSNYFKCEKESIHFSSRYQPDINDVVDIQAFPSGMRLTWNLPRDDIIENITVTYCEPGHLIETYLNATLSDIKHNKQTDIFDLCPEPSPVNNLSATIENDTIRIQWIDPPASLNDHFLIEHRMIRRQPKTSFIESNASNSSFTLPDIFPGEEYEFQVSSVSNHKASLPQSISLIVPPLPPEDLKPNFPSYSPIGSVSWKRNETRTHVEQWNLRYNSSDGDTGERVVHIPDNGNHVEEHFTNFHKGETYTVAVQSSVGETFSESQARADFTVPRRTEQHSESTSSSHTTAIVIVLVIVLAILVGVVIIQAVWNKKDSRSRQISQRTKIEYNTNIKSDVVNINEASTADLIKNIVPEPEATDEEDKEGWVFLGH